MKLKIKEILKQKGLTQIEIAKRLGVTKEGFNKKINGNPTVDSLLEIAKILDVDVKDFFYSTNGTKTINLIIDNNLYQFTNQKELKAFVNTLE